MGQKGRRLNDNKPLFENKTAEADLGNSFQIRTPENLANNFEKLDLVLKNTPYVRPAVKTQNDSGIETPNDTVINFNTNNVHRFNTKPTLSLSTKRSLYYNNKENLPDRIKEDSRTPESQKLTQNNSSTFDSLTVKENLENNANRSVNVNEDTAYVSPETSKFNYDTSLYHSVRETVTALPDSSHSSFSMKYSDSLGNFSSSSKQLGCQSLDVEPKHNTLELSPAAKLNNYAIRARSPIHPTPVEFIQDGEFKRPINSTGNVCLKCANENYICVRGINYSILNTLGHGGSSVVYEVNM